MSRSITNTSENSSASPLCLFVPLDGIWSLFPQHSRLPSLTGLNYWRGKRADAYSKAILQEVTSPKILRMLTTSCSPLTSNNCSIVFADVLFKKHKKSNSLEGAAKPVALDVAAGWLEPREIPLVAVPLPFQEQPFLGLAASLLPFPGLRPREVANFAEKSVMLCELLDASRRQCLSAKWKIDGRYRQHHEVWEDQSFLENTALCIVLSTELQPSYTILRGSTRNHIWWEIMIWYTLGSQKAKEEKLSGRRCTWTRLSLLIMRLRSSATSVPASSTSYAFQIGAKHICGAVNHIISQYFSHV